MPRIPKDVLRGDPILAKEYNTILSELRRLGRQDGIGGDGNLNNFKSDQIIFGVVVDAGPAAELDFVDARYWVQHAIIEQTEVDNTETEISFEKRPSSGDYLYEIITATNLAETRLDADVDTVTLLSHRVQVGSPVVVLRFLDDGSPSTPRYFFWQPPSTLQRMRVKEEREDYLRCKTWDGTTEGTDFVNVAKPYDLQRVPFDGQTVNGKTYTYLDVNRRTVNDSARTYNQIIREEYYTDAEIYASYRPKGDTGITDVYWVDDNLAARRWVREAYLLENCADSTDKRLVSGDLIDFVGRIIRLYSTGETCWKVSEAMCDCDLEEVVAEADFSTCDDCLPVCVTLTRCVGETTGSATLEVRSNGAILNATIVEYDETCYTVTLPEDTCTGSEIEIAPNDWTDYSSCDACRESCHTVTCCTSADTLAVKARGLLAAVGATISIEGTPGCWTVASEEACAGHVLINYNNFADCTACQDATFCYGYTPCDVAAPDTMTIYSMGTEYAIGDTVIVDIDGTSWCFQIDSVSSGVTCGIPCNNVAGSGTTNEYYEILDQTPSDDCEECTPCVTAVRCDDNTITDIFRGIFEIGKVYDISSVCWEITGKAVCDGGATTDADNSSKFDDCLTCESAGICYNITPCAGGAAILVSGDLDGVTTICRGGVSYTVASAACTGSEVPVGAYTILVDCDGCPEGFVKKTVVTAFDPDTCEITTEDICILEPEC